MKALLTKEQPFWYTFLKSVSIFAIFFGLLYCIPSPYDAYIANTYAFLLNVVIGVYLIALAASYANSMNSIEFKHVEKRIEMNDLRFMLRMLKPELRMRINLTLASIVLISAMLVGYVVESAYLYWTLLIWSLVYFVTSERLESLVSEKYRDKIVDHINNLKSTNY